MITIFVLLGIVLVAILLLMVRNEKVCQQRVALIWEDRDAYHRLPSYDHMLFCFWIPVKRFIEEARLRV